MSGEQSTEQQNTVASQVQALVEKAQPTDKGLMLDAAALEGVDPILAHAAQTELRYRNTQSNYTKSQQELSKVTAVNQELKNRVESSLDLGLSIDEAKALKDLKINNPDEWRKQLGVYETRAKDKLKADFDAIEAKGATLSVVEQRKQQLQAFNESTGLTLTDDVIKDELPPRFMKDLETGKIDFLQFLKNSADYLTKNKIIKGSKDNPNNDPNLGDMAGGSTPSEEAIGGDIVQKYESTIF